MPSTPVRIVHVITGLGTGGAESMLQKLLSAMDRARFESSVISLTDARTIGDRIAASGIPVDYLGMTRGRPSPAGLLRLARRLRVLRPALVQTWMYHADLLGGIAARLAGVPHVVWNIRHSDLPPRSTSWSTRLTARLCAFLSPLIPDRIVVNAQRSIAAHDDLGYATDRFIVIGNGFDTGRFRPDPEARLRLRRELDLDDETEIVGHVARFDPQKDHATLLAAAAIATRQRSAVHFVLVGRGVDARNPELATWLRKNGCADRVHLLGERHDIPRLTAAFDVAVSSSAYGEGFSNALGEAMACGVPCVATDVGDSAAIVDSTGRVVPARDPAALAAAIAGLLALGSEERRRCGERGLQRVRDHFSIDTIARRYEALYESLL